jgi:hypothetical protein
VGPESVFSTEGEGVRKGRGKNRKESDRKISKNRTESDRKNSKNRKESDRICAGSAPVGPSLERAADSRRRGRRFVPLE